MKVIDKDEQMYLIKGICGFCIHSLRTDRSLDYVMSVLRDDFDKFDCKLCMNSSAQVYNYVRIFERVVEGKKE